MLFHGSHIGDEQKQWVGSMGIVPRACPDALCAACGLQPLTCSLLPSTTVSSSWKHFTITPASFQGGLLSLSLLHSDRLVLNFYLHSGQVWPGLAPSGKLWPQVEAACTFQDRESRRLKMRPAPASRYADNSGGTNKWARFFRVHSVLGCPTIPIGSSCHIYLE